MRRSSRPWWGARAVAVLTLALCCSAGWALDVPPLTGRVVDLSGVLPSTVRETLTAKLVEHERATGNQLAVLIVPSLEGDDLFEFSHRVATTWHLGTKGTDNGVLLLVAVKDRKIRLEVGYGLEGALTDARASQIIRREIVPRFRAGDLPGGVTAGVEAVLQTIAGTYVAPAEPPAASARGDWLQALVFAVIAGLVVGLVVSVFNRVVGPMAGSAIAVATAPWIWPAVMAGGITLLLVSLLGAQMGGTMPGGRGGRRSVDDGWWYRSHDGGWSAGSGGGWSGGGDIGFSGGGGDFGGGGASGDW